MQTRSHWHKNTHRARRVSDLLRTIVLVLRIVLWSFCALALVVTLGLATSENFDRLPEFALLVILLLAFLLVALEVSLIGLRWMVSTLEIATDHSELLQDVLAYIAYHSQLQESINVRLEQHTEWLTAGQSSGQQRAQLLTEACQYLSELVVLHHKRRDR
jgi:hypothetical protein